jgi:hypothetical protein
MLQETLAVAPCLFYSQENLLITNLLLQQQPTAVTLERKAHEAVLTARVVLIVDNRLGGCAASEVKGAVVGRLDVELDVVVILALGLATIEFRDLPDIVAFCGDGAGSSDLARLERGGEGEAAESEEGCDGGELHVGGFFRYVDLGIGKKAVLKGVLFGG